MKSAIDQSHSASGAGANFDHLHQGLVSELNYWFPL
jgi:hypothetical protein